MSHPDRETANWSRFEEAVTECLRDGCPEEQLVDRVRSLAEYERLQDEEDAES